MDCPDVFGEMLIVFNCSVLSFWMQINIRREWNPQYVTNWCQKWDGRKHYWLSYPNSSLPYRKNKNSACYINGGTFIFIDPLYQTLKFITSKRRSVLTDEHLTELLWTALIKQNCCSLKVHCATHTSDVRGPHVAAIRVLANPVT
jgi:hypothetical protein